MHFFNWKSSLKTQTIRTIENLDQQIQEQEKLRQNARSILAIIQRTKVQLIELRPTMNDEAKQKLQVAFSLRLFCLFWINFI